MSVKELVSINGKLLDAARPQLPVSNRAFRYGDGIFETIRLYEGDMPLYQLHYERLKSSSQLLKLRFTKKHSETYFKEQIMELAHARGMEGNARVRLSLFRKEGGNYQPESAAFHTLIEVHKMEEELFPYHKEGVKIDIYSEMEKAATRLSNIKSCNALLYVLAALHKKEHALDDCLLINSKGRVIEAIESNFFLVEKGVIYTPSLADGCVDGVMRRHLMNLLKDSNISITESSISPENLFSADEILLTNSIRGIRCAASYKSREYDCTIGKELYKLLTESIYNKA